MIGWAIQQGKEVMDGREEVLALKDALRGVFKGRDCQNWAILLFFVKKVSARESNDTQLTPTASIDYKCIIKLHVHACIN